MTLEEAQAKLKEVEVERDTLRTQLTDATNSRNTSSLQRHALNAVLEAHNITFDVETANLSALTVGADGAVAGEFAYTPPAVERQTQPPTAVERQTQPPTNEQQPQQQPPTNGLTIEHIKAMSEDQINERWDEVSVVLESQRG